LILLFCLQPDYYHDADQFVREGDGPLYRFNIPCVKLDFTGAYTVIARNIHGEAKAIISLQVKAHGESVSSVPFSRRSADKSSNAPARSSLSDSEIPVVTTCCALIGCALREIFHCIH
jgi:hypothetical protein